MDKKAASKEPVPLTELADVTGPADRRLDAVAFAGFLIREDADSLYVADRKGTWVIPRENLAFMEPWEAGAQVAPDMLKSEGKPVHVGVKSGSKIYEIRPWVMQTSDGGLFRRNVRRKVESIFSLGGPGLPVTQQTFVGENQVAALERTFARRLGWDPRLPGIIRRADDGGDGGETATATVNCSGECWYGSSDTD
jgi:hypothetical protein